MSAIPGMHREPGSMPGANCGCLFWAAALGLICGGAMLWLGLYATSLVE